MDNLHSFAVRFVKGVGPSTAQKLEKIGVTTLKDLLYFFPALHLERGSVAKINQIQDDSTCVIEGKISYLDLVRTRRYTITKGRLKDDTSGVEIVWFNQPYIINNLKKGDCVRLYGDLKDGIFRVREYEKLGDNQPVHLLRLVPSYSVGRIINQRKFRRIMQNAIENELNKNVTETIPEKLLKSRRFMDIAGAIKAIHFPIDYTQKEAARRRFAYEELLEFQIAILKARESLRRAKKQPMVVTRQLDTKIRALFPFKFTSSQESVINHIQKDLMSGVCMNRLIQGDVGSGKTVVAVYAAAVMIANKFQVCFLAPTEILAQQHYFNICRLLKHSNIKIALMTSSTAKSDRQEILQGLSNGSIDFVLGTHALIEESIRFRSLGLAITDEQHKFGLWQRARLVQKGSNPHVLVMTATPIPRTLAMVLFGELDVSIISELPYKRDVRTMFKEREGIEGVFSFIHEEVEGGAQAFFIYPTIEGSAKSDQIQSAKEMYQVLAKKFQKSGVGLIHGRLSAFEKEKVIRDFRTAKVKILVSTTVVEVGMDIPNATIMVIDNCERYGLNQLHQLRGRIGRRGEPSYCIMVGRLSSPESKQRVNAMLETNDGFKISQRDLEIRGPGDIFGPRQSGIPYFKAADIVKDADLLMWASEDASMIINDKLQQIISSALRKYRNRLDFARIG